jgi:DNA invertase Pin-like site-specific DNA recombinase
VRCAINGTKRHVQRAEADQRAASEKEYFDWLAANGASKKTYADLADEFGIEDAETVKQRVMRARRRQMLGVFAEFERAMIRERVMSGLARARADGKQLGRRTVEQSHARKVKAALALRSKGHGIRRIASEVGLGIGTVIRLVGKEADLRPA